MTPPIAASLSGAHLVVTGTTGFVGKVWLSMLLTHVPDIGRVTLLVRGRRDRSAAARMAHAFDTCPVFRPLRDAVPGDLGAWLDGRVEVLDADITRADLGLDDATRAGLAASADAVVHIAGLTDFHPDPAKGFPANVDGAVHMGRFAATLRHPRMLHVSTAYVAGVADGRVEETLTPGVSPTGRAFDPDAVVREIAALCADEPDAAARTERVGARACQLGWPNNYTFSKGLAEHLLAELPVDLCIVRPSVVECARTFPFPGWNEGLNTSGPIMAYCGSAFRALPSTGHHTFDIVPVDAVTRWMTVALVRLLHGTHAPVYHLASGDVNPATFDRIVELTALGHRRLARDGGSFADRVRAHVDAVARRHDDLPAWRPEAVESTLGWLDDRLRTLSQAGALPAGLRESVRKARRPVSRQRRDLGRVRRMLDVYRPFIHDHDWTFVTAAIRDATAALGPDDHPWRDDLRDLCWRSYWLDVQVPGIARWAFPLLRGEPVPVDPPSSPPLALGRHSPPWSEIAPARGVA